MERQDQGSVAARLPILQGLLPITAAEIPGEIVAGVTLAALAVPEVMGYTKISGTPVITGLYTILVPVVLYAVFGASRHLVVGADSATAAILASGLAGIAATGSDEYVELAGVLALMAAGFLILARVMRLGFMADFLSRTVLIGFLTGVGIQVALGELAGMLGLEAGGPGTPARLWSDLRHVDQLNPSAVAISASVLMVILVSRLISKRIPGALIAVVGSMVASWAFGFDAYVRVLGAVPHGLPSFGIPKAISSWSVVANLVPAAFAMFVVILAQSAATSRAYAVRYGERFDENTDLVGLSLANIGAGLSGAFVVNGSPTKTQMVVSAGGRTQLSLLVMAAVVLFVLLFLTAPLAYLPESVLSAIVFLIGLDLIDLAGLRSIYDERRSEFWVALVTTLTVVIVGVEQGILLAIALSLIEHTRHGYRPRNAVLVQNASGAWQPQPVARATQTEPGLVVYRFTHSLYYANVQQLSDEVSLLVTSAKPPLRWLCLDASAIDDIDYTAAEMLRSIYTRLKGQGVRLIVAEVMPDVEAVSRFRFREIFADDGFYPRLVDVVARYRSLDLASESHGGSS